MKRAANVVFFRWIFAAIKYATYCTSVQLHVCGDYIGNLLHIIFASFSRRSGEQFIRHPLNLIL